MRISTLIFIIVFLPLFSVGCIEFLTECTDNIFIFRHPDFDKWKPYGKILIIPVIREHENRKIYEYIARQFSNELNDKWGNVINYDTFLLEITKKGLTYAVEELANKIVNMVNIDEENIRLLRDEFHINSIIVTDLYFYEQYWGKVTKITRVGLEIKVIQLFTGNILFSARYSPEIRSFNEKGFNYATRKVISRIVNEMSLDYSP